MEPNYWTRRTTRRGFIRGAGVAATVVTLAPSLAACGGSKKNARTTGAATASVAAAGRTSTAAASAAEKPVRGGTLTMAMAADITSFDPAKIQDGYSNAASSNMVDALVRFDHDLKPQPGLATSWDVSSDATQFTFHLRPSVKFHDGTDFNADAVKFNLNRQIQDKAAVRHQDVADVQDVTVIDPMTIKLTLGHSFAPFLTKLSSGAGYMLSPAAVQKLGDKLSADFTGAGTGPYKFQEWAKADHFTAVRNESYWEKDANGAQLPYADKIILKPIPDENTRLANLKSGEVDAFRIGEGPPPKDVAAIKQDPTLTYRDEPGLIVEFINFEVDKPPFDRKELRQALSYAIDRSQIVKTVLYDTAAPWDTMIPPTVFGSDPNYHPYLKQDIDKAKQLLQQAGQTKLSFTCQVSSNAAINQQMFELIKDQIAPAGFDMQIQEIDFTTWLANANKGDYQVGGGVNWGGGIDPDGYFYSLFYTKAGFNITHYSNPDLDKLMDQGRQTLDQQARIPIYRQLNKSLAEDLPFTVTYTPVTSVLTLKKVHNYPLGTEPVAGVSQVWKTA